MNAAFFLKKTPFVFLLLFCFVISFDFVEAETSIRLRKIKTYIAPRHISLSARSGNGIYARRYAYGRPIPSYSTKGKLRKNRRSYAGRIGNRKRGETSRTYASRYKNWTPNRNIHGGRNNPRADKVGQKKRKELYPFLVEPPVGGSKSKRRVRPHRLNAMQRPQPPKKSNEFDEDYFFPEEAKRAETKYEYESRYPRPKKKRRPEFTQSFKTPNLGSKIPLYDDRPLPYKTNTREPPFSYTSFVQHPSGFSDDLEEFNEDLDTHYFQPMRNKKKRVKKKPNSRKKNKEQFKPFVFESDQLSENYPPYPNSDEYELPIKSYKKRNKPSYDPINDDDDFIPSKPSYSKPKPQVNTLFSTDSEYRGSQNSQQTSHYSPTYSQTWPQASVFETTARPVQYQAENGFQPQYIPNQYKDYSSQHKTVTTNTQQSSYYSQPDNDYRNIAYNNNNNNYVSSQVSSAHSQAPTNYNSYSNSYSSQPTYSQPLPSSGSVLTDITIQKSVPIYDNTETFYNFNNNAFLNSQSSKYSNADGVAKYADSSQNYGNRLLPSSTPYRNKVNEKTDSDSDFIKKHQNLYNNGLSGVPIQGDGYAKETMKKDYDIGYGDFQFDENPSS